MREKHILAILGSLRKLSTNSALLVAAREHAPSELRITIFPDLAALPAFSPDLEQGKLPHAVERLAEAVGQADGLLISSPEYVRSIPGALKNAIDWLVSREELIAKPIAVLHASHRGDDMLDALRKVLATVSARFEPELFERFQLMSMSPDAIARQFSETEEGMRLRSFLVRYAAILQHSE